MTGQLFTGGGGKIVGPGQDAIALHEAINDLTLQVAFVEGATAAMVYTRAMMAQIDVDHPVLALPANARELWEADPHRPEHLKVEYTGPLPTTGRKSSFEIVRPGRG